MKTFIVLAALVAIAVSIPADTYNSDFDNFNAQEIVENPRLLKNYLKCFLDQGPCTAEGTDIKKIIPEALKTSCAKCSPKQRELIRIVVHAFQDKLPELWKELVQKQDPKGDYQEKFKKFLEASD